MNLFKIILIFTTFAVQYTIAAVRVTDPEAISFYNQSQFEIVRSRIDECNHSWNTNYTLVASRDGTWVAFTYDNDTEPENELEIAFMDCVDPSSIYPLAYEFRTIDMSRRNDEIQESTEGPDSLGTLLAFSSNANNTLNSDDVSYFTFTIEIINETVVYNWTNADKIITSTDLSEFYGYVELATIETV
ncbi:uncharacterized protein RJT20DRAFT_5362 [Scheffersomyces xylosifermentans]|uniref:uncharacterized protein n=1 Tax=Scheffersomyces xylosifermentans TaxID=1304137 RepID=UPI00315C84F6